MPGAGKPLRLTPEAMSGRCSTLSGRKNCGFRTCSSPIPTRTTSADLEAPPSKETKAEVWPNETGACGHPRGKDLQGECALPHRQPRGQDPDHFRPLAGPDDSYYVTGLSYPLAIVGDSLFASSMGGSADHFEEQHHNDVQKVLALPRDTVLACGHGPLSTVGQEKRHNPFFAG